jgi:hypothetical protein
MLSNRFRTSMQLRAESKIDKRHRWSIMPGVRRAEADPST